MNPTKKLSVILAAGKGTRMDSNIPKPMNQVDDKPIISWLIESFKKNNIDIVLVISEKDLGFFNDFKNDVKFVYQNSPLGTGDALMKALDDIKLYDLTYVFMGDSPFVGSDLISQMYDSQISVDSDCTILSSIFKDKKFPYARIIRKKNSIVKIVEEKDASRKELIEQELFCSHYLFKSSILLDYMKYLKPNIKTGEIYLTDILNVLLENNKKINSLIIDDWKRLVGLNTKEDILWIESQKMN